MAQASSLHSLEAWATNRFVPKLKLGHKLVPKYNLGTRTREYNHRLLSIVPKSCKILSGSSSRLPGVTVSRVLSGFSLTFWI